MAFTIPLTTITINFGKTKERSKMCEVLTDDGRWIDKEMPVLSSCVANKETREAYLLDDNNQFRGEDKNDRQFLSEKTCIPLAMRVESQYQPIIDAAEEDAEKSGDSADASKTVMEALRNALYQQAFRQKQSEGIQSINDGDKFDRAWKITMLICSTLIIIFGIRWLAGGF